MKDLTGYEKRWIGKAKSYIVWETEGLIWCGKQKVLWELKGFM